jgi:hypothetical protein
VDGAVVRYPKKKLPSARVGEGDDLASQGSGISGIILKLMTTVLTARDSF